MYSTKNEATTKISINNNKPLHWSCHGNKAVRLSLRTHLNFEGSTPYNARKDETVNHAKNGPQSIDNYIDNYIDNKAHTRTPVTQYRMQGNSINKGRNSRQTRYRHTAVRLSLRTHQNIEATTSYESRLIGNILPFFCPSSSSSAILFCLFRNYTSYSPITAVKLSHSLVVDTHPSNGGSITYITDQAKALIPINRHTNLLPIYVRIQHTVVQHTISTYIKMYRMQGNSINKGRRLSLIHI